VSKSKKAVPMKHVVQLSYLHRNTLLAQIRSYSHLAMCFLSRGEDEESLYYSNRANSLVTYFSDQSKATRAPSRTSAFSRTTVVIDQTRLYDATVCANAGTISYTMGSVPKSLEMHEHAAKLFNEIGDASALAKERGNLGCIWLEIGKALNSLHWIDTIETAADGAHSYEDVETIVFDASSPFWGPPQIDKGESDDESKDGNGGVVCAGSKLVEKAIIMVIGMMEKSKRLDDWMGVMTSCLNLGIFLFGLIPDSCLLYRISAAFYGSVLPNSDVTSCTGSGRRPRRSIMHPAIFRITSHVYPMPSVLSFSSHGTKYR
jgi:hypothetical protein